MKSKQLDDSHGLCPNCKQEPEGVGYLGRYYMVCHSCKLKWLWYDRTRSSYGTDEKVKRLLDSYRSVEPTGLNVTEKPTK